MTNVTFASCACQTKKKVFNSIYNSLFGLSYQSRGCLPADCFFFVVFLHTPLKQQDMMYQLSIAITLSSYSYYHSAK